MAHRYNLHVEFDSLAKQSQIRRLNKAMDDMDYDWCEGDVYQDGIRMVWRAPLIDQEDIIKVFKMIGLKGRGYFLPTGQNCPGILSSCVDAWERDHDSTPGYRWCDAIPQESDWFTF